MRSSQNSIGIGSHEYPDIISRSQVTSHDFDVLGARSLDVDSIAVMEHIV